jgi:hypothetical protein
MNMNNINGRRHWKLQKRIEKYGVVLYKGPLITEVSVIPAEAGIQNKTGFRVKAGMTNGMKPMSCGISTEINHARLAG